MGRPADLSRRLALGGVQSWPRMALAPPALVPSHDAPPLDAPLDVAIASTPRRTSAAEEQGWRALRSLMPAAHSGQPYVVRRPGAGGVQSVVGHGARPAAVPASTASLIFPARKRSADRACRPGGMFRRFFVYGLATILDAREMWWSGFPSERPCP